MERPINSNHKKEEKNLESVRTFFFVCVELITHKNSTFEQNYIMIVVFIRVLIIYITVLVFLRLIGKRQIGEMQPYEVVITLIIADLATLPMSDSNIPLLHGILPLAVLVLIHFLITFLTRKNIKIRRIMSGRPIVVISPKGLEYQAFKDLNINIDDLIEMLRQNGYYSFEQVLYAIIETNGKISVIPKRENAPATASDIGVNNPQAQLPSIVVSDGKMMKSQMQEVELNDEKLNKLLNHLKINSISELIILSIDKNGKVYYQTKNECCKTIENIHKEITL